MIKLIKAIRLPECFGVVALGFIAFKYAGIKPESLTLITLLFVIASTMLQNDWRDRFHDIEKGKTFASERPALFLCWLILFWIICGGLIMVLFFKYPIVAGFLLGLAAIGAVYSETRRLPLLPVTLVSFTAASPILLPLAFGASFAVIAPLFAATVLILFGRETLHDIADAKVDRGYKQTVPLFLGDKLARIAVAATLVGGCGFAVAISPTALIGSAFIIWGLTGIVKDIRVVQVRRRIDVGLVFLALGLALA